MLAFPETQMETEEQAVHGGSQRGKCPAPDQSQGSCGTPAETCGMSQREKRERKGVQTEGADSTQRLEVETEGGTGREDSGS